MSFSRDFIFVTLLSIDFYVKVCHLSFSVYPIHYLLTSAAKSPAQSIECAQQLLYHRVTCPDPPCISLDYAAESLGSISYFKEC